MSEFSIEFYFDLQRFATFKGGTMGDDETGVLSYLFDGEGNAVTKKDMAASDKGNNLFWSTSALVSLSPKTENAFGAEGAGDAISLVSGSYNTTVVGKGTDAERTGYVITGLDAIDLQGASGVAFSKIDKITLLNPNGTIAVGSNTLTFSGGGLANAETLAAFGDWDVGTRVSVNGGEIVNATMTAGEVVTTANGMSAAFTDNTAIATFSNKSFNTINVLSTKDGTAALSVNDSEGGAKSYLNVSASAVGLTSTVPASAITAVFSGQSLQSVKFDGKEASVEGSIEFGGQYSFSRDVTVQGSAINVAKTNISGASSAIKYFVGEDLGDSIVGNVLDVTGVQLSSTDDTPTAAKSRITVSKVGGANFVLARDYRNDTDDEMLLTTINIAGVNYQFNDADGTSGNGGLFEITDGAVTGFVFRDEGDSITIPKGTGLTEFNLYTADSTGGQGAVDNAEATMITGLKKVTFNLSGDTGSTEGINITQGVQSPSGKDTFEIIVYDAAALEITNDETGTNVGMEFTLPKASGSSNKSAAKIVVDTEGVIQSIDTGQVSDDGTFTASTDDGGVNVGGTKVEISGATSDAVEGGTLTINNIPTNVASGNVDYVVAGTKGSTENIVRTMQLTSADDTIGAIGTTDDPVKVTPYQGEEGTITYGDNEYVYTFKNAEGNAYLYANGDTLQFVFVDEGDSITIPEEAADTTTLMFVNRHDPDYNRYDTTAAQENLPSITVTSESGNGSYTIEMTTETSARSGKAEFTVADLTAGSYVTYDSSGDAPAVFTYSDAGGTFLFGKEDDGDATATGFTAASGTVTLDQNAAAQLAANTDDGNAAVFKVDGTAVAINAVTEAANDNQLRYNKSNNSLYGLGDGSVIYNAGSITKIYAQNESGDEVGFTFGGDDSESEEDDQVFYALNADGDIDDPSDSAYFVVDVNKVTGFVFAAENDQLRSESGFDGITLYDTSSDTTGFEAPEVTDLDGNATAATIVKTRDENTGNACYAFLGADLDDKIVTFEDGTTVTFTVANEDPATELLFSTTGKMLAINNLDFEGNQVIIDNATGEVNIDGNIVEITGGGFTYTMASRNNPTITDLKAGSTVIQAAGITQILTIGGESGLGEFTFGASSAAKTYTVAGDSASVDGVTFTMDGNIAVTGISGVDNTESVTGALANLALNGTSVVIDEATEGYDGYTFSGVSFAGLQSGDKVLDAGDIADFITGASGAFEILGTSMAIDGDSSVVFSVADDALTGIRDLAGTATGDFQEELGVNNETIKVTGDSSVAVEGDNEVVTAIGNVGGGSIALEQIGSASTVATDADGVFAFVEAQQIFGTSTSDGVTFGIEDNKVTSITGVDQEGERVWGDFSEGISVDGNLVQVENSEDITYVTGSYSGMSGTGIYGLKDGANVVSASGLDVAVAVGQSGTYTFNNGEQTFTIANDSNEHVGFLLENGKVTGIFDVDGEVSGDLNGVTINQQAPDISVVGGDGDNTNLTYNNGVLTGIRDGDTVYAADNATTVRAIEAGTFTFGGKSYTTDDEDGIDFIITKGTTDVIGIDALADGAILTGALSGLSAGINGQSVVILNDSDFGVVGAGESAGIKEIFDVSDGAEVVYAGGASKITTDLKGTFTIGGESFTTEEDDVVEFALDGTGSVTGISGLSGGVVANNTVFEEMTINGQSFSITGDEDDLRVVGTDTEDAISAIEKVGGAVVAINDAGSATSVKTDKAGAFNFVKGGQSFLTNDDEVGFTLDGETEKVTDITELDGNITGNFDEVGTINERQFDVKDNDNKLTVTGQGGSAIAKISDVDGDGDGATITNVGGASQVITGKQGSFTFGDKTFETSGDDEITFDMVEDADAQVKGIDGIDDGAVTGNLSDIESINGQSFAVTGDEDESLTYEKNGSAATVSGVAGENVDIQGLAGASTIEIEQVSEVGDNYTFGDKSYTFAAGSATIGVKGLSVTSVDGIDQDGEFVAGDFTESIALDDKNFNVTGDSAITVTQENGKLVISGLNDGATIKAAGGVSTTAITEEEGTFTDADDHKLIIGNGDVTLSLDDAAHFNGVSGVTGGIGGDIGGLPIDGSSSLVNVISAPDGQPSTNLTLNGDTLSGVVANDTIISAGKATMVVADGADGSYQFGTGSAAKRFDIVDDTNGVLEFAVGGTSNTVVSAVSDIDEGAILVGELNGVAVNGVNVSVTGDSDDIFGVIGDVGGGISALINVGGGSRGVTVMSAGGADEVITSTEGKFTFNGSGQKFTVAGDSSVSFGIEGNAGQESVTAVGNLDGTVASDFANGIAVNDQAIVVLGDKDGNSVVGYDGTSVTSIDDVNAGATVETSGQATTINTKGEGVYAFTGDYDERFSVEGDAAISFNVNENGNVVGVDNFVSGKLVFDPATSPVLEINPDVNDPVSVGAASGVAVTVEVDSAGKIIGVAGADTISGLEEATINATGPITINGKDINVVDDDASFNVEVKDFEVDKVTGVTGPAIVDVEDGVIEANSDGIFIIGGESYTFVDSNDNFGFTTAPNGDLDGVTSLEGAIVVEDGAEELTVNGNYVEVVNGSSAPVSIVSDGTNITAVNGLSTGAVIEGDLSNASIAVANDTSVTVNGIPYAPYDDTDGIIVNGAGGVTGLDDDGKIVVQQAGQYVVNGDVLNAVVGDTIVGAGSDGGAYLYDPDNILVRRTTPIDTIASLTGVPTTVDALVYDTATATPLTKAQSDSLLGADSGFDWDRSLEIYATNPDDTVTQTLDFSDKKFTKKVHLYDGPQAVVFNNDGGNLAHIAETNFSGDPTSGVKNVTFGDGAGDVAIVDQGHDIGNAVNIFGGAGDDSIFVRNNVETTIDMSEGGADRVVTFAKANARIKLEGYNASTGAGIQFDQRETMFDKGIASAIEKGVIDFGDGVVSLTTASGNTQVSLNGATGGTNSLGGSVVNLFTPEGYRQQVGFTHSAGGVATVDAASTEDVIFIGNKDGKKVGGSTLGGGLGNDVAFAGEGDFVDMGGGLNSIVLQDNAGREGAFVNLSAGSTEIRGMNNTLDEIHGDTLGVDLTQAEFSYVNGNLIVKSKEGATTQFLATVVGADQDGTLSYDTASTATSADLAESADGTDTTTGGTSTATTEDSIVAAAITSSLVPDHNYTNQIISSNGTIRQVAIGATGSVIDVKLDEDVRADYYIGDDSGLTFYGYNGDVLIDLGGDWQTSRIDETEVTVEGINSIAAGTGRNVIKGSDESETFFAGRGNTYIYGDGGKNLLVGYEGLDKEGQTTFYVLGHSQYAANTIQAFDFVSDDNYTNNNRITADIVNVDLPTNFVSRVDLSNDNVLMEVTNRDGSTTESVIITGAKNKDILVSGDGIVADVVAQVGDDTLIFDKFANYYNATGKNATVTVSNDTDYARVWLDNASLTGTTFVGDIHEINASLYSGAAELAGNDYNNTIIAGSGATSLWGGNRGDDALVAGTGQDTFFYTIGNGTDTIYGAKNGDIVNLAGVTLDQLDTANFAFSETGVKLAFKDGGVLYIGDNGGNDVSYIVEGQTYFVNDSHNGFERKQ